MISAISAMSFYGLWAPLAIHGIIGVLFALPLIYCFNIFVTKISMVNASKPRRLFNEIATRRSVVCHLRRNASACCVTFLPGGSEAEVVLGSFPNCGLQKLPHRIWARSWVSHWPAPSIVLGMHRSMLGRHSVRMYLVTVDYVIVEHRLRWLHRLPGPLKIRGISWLAAMRVCSVEQLPTRITTVFASLNPALRWVCVSISSAHELHKRSSSVSMILQDLFCVDDERDAVSYALRSLWFCVRQVLILFSTHQGRRRIWRLTHHGRRRSQIRSRCGPHGEPVRRRAPHVLRQRFV